MQNDRQVAVGHLQNFQDAGSGADPIQVIGPRLFYFGVFLQNSTHHAARRLDVTYQAHRTLSSDGDWGDRTGEEYRTAQGQDRQGFGYVGIFTGFVIFVCDDGNDVVFAFEHIRDTGEILLFELFFIVAHCCFLLDKSYKCSDFYVNRRNGGGFSMVVRAKVGC